jgi:hypothetical protein
MAVLFSIGCFNETTTENSLTTFISFRRNGWFLWLAVWLAVAGWLLCFRGYFLSALLTVTIFQTITNK